METDRKYVPRKETRGWYFIEYHPPSSFKFAYLHITIIIEDANKNDVISAMEKEAEYWLNLYPIPVHVTAFDNKEDIFSFKGLKERNNLIAFIDKNDKLQLHWELLKDEEIPNIALDKEYLNDLYAGFIYTTHAKLDVDRKKRRKQIEDGFFIIIILFGVIPFFFEIFIYFNNLFSFFSFVYLLYKSVQKILKLANMWPKSKREKEKEEQETLKEHYYYYCQMNPEGFKKLKSETLEIMAKKKVAEEAAALKKID